jgi:hypothetical protein
MGTVDMSFVDPLTRQELSLKGTMCERKSAVYTRTLFLFWPSCFWIQSGSWISPPRTSRFQRPACFFFRAPTGPAQAPPRETLFAGGTIPLRVRCDEWEKSSDDLLQLLADMQSIRLLIVAEALC